MSSYWYKKKSRLNLHNNVCAPFLVILFQSPSNPPTAAPLQSSGTNQTTSNNTGLIVGLSVGLSLFLILIIIGLIILFFCLKKAKKKSKKKKPVSRATAVGQKSGDNLSTRVQPRNLRAVRLAPIPAASTSVLPDVPVKVVTPTANSSLSYPNKNVRASARGIPLRLDAVR